MDASIKLGTLDIITFAAYFIGIVGYGIWLSFREKANTKDYFLAGGKLPWYAIGASIIATTMSTEHFIGLVGWAFTYGFVVANFEWGAWYTWSIALFFFLPFYFRTKIYTVPEFMERRYCKGVRYLLAITSVIAYVTAFEAGVMYAGAKALDVMFGLPLVWGVILLGLVTGVYTIAGGLFSVVWTDFIQCILFIIGGSLVTVLGLIKVGGLGALMTSMPEKFHMYYLVHDKCPIIAYYICGFFVGAYYIASNQFVVQRCLGARSQWDGRMGLLVSNYLKLLTPFIIVLPGILAFRLFPELKDPDQCYPVLVNSLLWPGISGIIMAGLAAAIMSTISSALNSASTLLTMDLYAPLLRRKATEKHLVKVGKILTGVVLVIGIFLGIFYTSLIDPNTGQPKPVFSLIMSIFFTIGPPISIILLAGIFWKRATPAAALSTIIGGYFAAMISKYLIFTSVDNLPNVFEYLLAKITILANLKGWIDGLWLVRNYNNFLGEAIWSGFVSLIIMLFVSLFTAPRPYNQIKDLLWRPIMLREKILDKDGKNRTRHLMFWWVVCMVITGLCYAFFAWFQITHK